MATPTDGDSPWWRGIGRFLEAYPNWRGLKGVLQHFKRPDHLVRRLALLNGDVRSVRDAEVIAPARYERAPTNQLSVTYRHRTRFRCSCRLRHKTLGRASCCK